MLTETLCCSGTNDRQWLRITQQSPPSDYRAIKESAIVEQNRGLSSHHWYCEFMRLGLFGGIRSLNLVSCPKQLSTNGISKITNETRRRQDEVSVS